MSIKSLKKNIQLNYKNTTIGEFWYGYEQTIQKIEKYFQKNNALLLWIKTQEKFERIFILKVSL